tara:strand:+ start:1784 stop:2956 length:1173 start_codon:yes stop_codon:yes gene_type:complete
VRIGLLKEVGNTRCVALTPQDVAWLVAQKFQVYVQTGAGDTLHFSDIDYTHAGATLFKTNKQIIDTSDIIVGLHLKYSLQRSIKYLKPHHYVLGLLNPLHDDKFYKKLNKSKVTAFSPELIPRITRAQSMDVLSSIATLAGYQAVISAADLSTNILPMMMTAAGTLTPSKVLVMGAGVAGLQACATAKRLGAVVEAYDIRAATREQIISVGARPIILDIDNDSSEPQDHENQSDYAKEQSQDFVSQQQKALTEVLASKDIIITTASIPGKPAPKLITKSMLKKMKEDAIVIDLAAASGGNTDVTKVGETIEYGSVTIMGLDDVTAFKPMHSSQMLSSNLKHFIALLGVKKTASPDFTDDIIRETCICHKGKIISAQLQTQSSKKKEKETA